MKIITFRATLTLLFPLLSTPVHAADLLATASKSSEIKTFVDAVGRAGLGNTLQGKGPFTVFAPSNSAFDKLAANEREALFKDKKKLAQLLAYHVVPGKTLVAEVKPGQTKTLHGDMVALKSDNGMVSINDARVTLSDLEADNGVIHVVDAVLVPRQ
jgi:uncharacterized surface protein with fasciclin (FAS1) repeats